MKKKRNDAERSTKNEIFDKKVIKCFIVVEGFR